MFNSTNLVYNRTFSGYLIFINHFFKLKIKITIILSKFIAVFILMITEAFGEDVKKSKYYYCATLIIYEFIWFFSIITYACLVMSKWPIEKCLEAFQNTPFKTIFVAVVGLLYFVWNKLICCPHWIRNSIVHMWLCRCKILDVNKLKEKYLVMNDLS